jgi:hypothetical protein
MATVTTPGFDFESATQHIRDLNERIVSSAKEAGETYLTAYEKTLTTIAQTQENVGKQSQVEWIADLAVAQASFTRDIAGAYAKAARSLLKN